MELSQAVKGRRSTRKFKADPIPRETIRDILETARWAPSWGNTQPWEFYVLTGKALEAFRKENHALATGKQAASPDVPMPEVWPDNMKKRYGELGIMLFKALDIKREDKEARNRHYENMTLMFGAPCLIVACIPKGTLVEYGMLDVGLVLQTICLLAHERGIGTCIMAATVNYPQVLRRIASIPEDRRVIMGVALGYPDPDHPLNHMERRRADADEIAKWIED